MNRRVAADFVGFASGLETLASCDPSVVAWFSGAAVNAIERTSWHEEWRKNPYFQGIYATAADGTGCRVLDDWERDGFLRQLDDVIAAFRAQPPQPITITEADVARAAPPGPHPSTSVLRLHYRCTPLPEGSAPVNQSVGRDHLWIYPDEIREIVAKNELPARLATRIVRFHLIDHVRGLGDAWAPEDVKESRLELALLEASAEKRVYALTGGFSCEKDYPGDVNYRGKLGVEGELAGFFEVVGDRIVRFRARVDATAWGANTNTWQQPSGRFPLVIAIVEADDELTRSVQPVWRAYGADYDEPR